MHPCITALCGCLYASVLKTLGVHFIRHPCLTRKLRVLPPAAPKIIPRLLSGRKCSGAGLSNRACSVGFASCLVSRLGCHIVWQLSAAAFKHPCLKLWASTITHPCTTRKLRVLAPAAPKIIPRLLSGRKCSEVCQNAVVGVGASLRRLCATAIVHPCTFMNALWALRPCKAFGRSFYKASMPYPHSASSPPSTKKSRAMPVCGSGSVAGFVKMRSLGSARPCADFVRPLSRILAFAVVGVGASLRDPHSAGSPPSTKKSRAMPV